MLVYILELLPELQIYTPITGLALEHSRLDASYLRHLSEFIKVSHLLTCSQ